MASRATLENWRFGILLIIVLGTLVVEPLLVGSWASNWIFDSAYSLILITGVLAITSRRRGRRLFISLGVFTLVATWVHHVVPANLVDAALVLYYLAGTAFLFLIVAVVLKGLFASRSITLDVILGSLTGYLLLGTAWAMLYALVFHLNPHAFAFHGELQRYTDDLHSRFSTFVYYSFVTMTTLGFGDISPQSLPARSCTWLQAVIGQFYMATLVAGIVSVFVSRKHEKS